MSGVGEQFQQETKYQPGKIPVHKLAWEARPPLYKDYPEAPRIGAAPRGRPGQPHGVAPTGPFEPPRAMSLDQALKQRKSIRDFQDKSISLGQLSYLLWASSGIQRIEDGYEFRTAPSAGALYPIETYVVANNVKALESGVYHYGVQAHQLEQLAQRDFRRQIAAAALGQEMCAAAAAVFVWSALFERCKWKYGQRAYRYIYLDAGHIAENLALAAVSINLGTCEIGALFDDHVNAIVGIDGVEESVICMAVVGVPL